MEMPSAQRGRRLYLYRQITRHSSLRFDQVPKSSGCSAQITPERAPKSSGIRNGNTDLTTLTPRNDNRVPKASLFALHLKG
jgi:hypothetical protein